MKNNYYAIIDNKNSKRPYVYYTTTSIVKAKKISSKMRMDLVLKLTDEEFRLIDNTMADVYYTEESTPRFSI